MIGEFEAMKPIFVKKKRGKYPLSNKSDNTSTSNILERLTGQIQEEISLTKVKKNKVQQNNLN